MTSEERKIRNALYLVRTNKENARWRMRKADRHHDAEMHAAAEQEFRRAYNLEETLVQKLEVIEFARKGA